MRRVTAFALATVLMATSAGAQTVPEKLLTSKPLTAARARFDADYDRALGDLVRLTEIPAPPFKEQARAAAFLQDLKDHNLSDVEMDAEGNVMGLRKGTGGKGLLVVAAHLDTVFPEGTDVKVRRDGDRMSAPGISDDTASLSTILMLIRAMDAAGLKTTGDILFVGDVGEEGLGDLRGVKYLFNTGKYAGRITRFISIEPGADGGIVNAGTGSKRYEVTVRGPGGHSYGAFGMVNPAYALAGAITGLAAYDAPKSPKTTFNVGVLSGGTSVNTIPSSVSMQVDMRSESAAELARLDSYFVTQLKAAVDAENARHAAARGPLSFELKGIGERPTGTTAVTDPLVKIAAAALSASGEKVVYMTESTDSNLPMSLNIPAITIGSGFASKGAHSPQEYITLNRDKTLKIWAADLAIIVAAANLPAKE